MKRNRVFLAIALLFVFIAGCTSQQTSYYQTEAAIKSIIANQPIPNLGGFSFEREMARQTMISRNRDVVSTYTYMFLETVSGGQIIEICPSMGYPIPYGVQMTSPTMAEANGLFYPDSAEATWVNCINDDGTVTPVYIEPRVIAFPYRIAADKKLDRQSDPTFKFNPKGGNKG
jgi:hypothetical protein